MEREVWKYEIGAAHEHTFEMPEGAVPIHVNTQERIGKMPVPCMWVEVDPTAEKVEREFRLVGTGHKFDVSDLFYIGTFHITQDVGPLVFHLYERG